MKILFFTIFTILIPFLRVFYVIYVKISVHVTVPLRTREHLVFKRKMQPENSVNCCTLQTFEIMVPWAFTTTISTMVLSPRSWATKVPHTPEIKRGRNTCLFVFLGRKC